MQSIEYNQDPRLAPIFLSNAQIIRGGSTLLYLIFGFVAAFIVYFSLMILIKTSPESIAKDSSAAERFIKNFYNLLEYAFVPDFAGLKRIFSGDAFGKIYSWIWLICWLISVIIIQVGLSSIYGPQIPGKGDYNLIQAGLILFFISQTAYLISRILSYFQDNLEWRKKISEHHREINANATPNPPVGRKAASWSSRFDESFHYVIRIKHIPVSYHLKASILNFLQILVLITEFFQLASFPIRDLFRNDAYIMSLQMHKNQNVKNIVDSIRSVLAAVSTGLSVSDYNYIKFVVCWWLTIISLFIAFFFGMLHLYIKKETRLSKESKKWLQKISESRWIIFSVPLINLLYLVILNSFLETLSCFSSNTTPSWPASFNDIYIASVTRYYECYAIYTVSPTVNTWLSLFGFTSAFFLFTICRTANEPIPEDGIISYTQRSELFTKMASVILLLSYALISSPGTATGRGSLALFLLFCMTIYNIVIGSTHVRTINMLRSYSYMLNLWLCAVITYYNSPDSTTRLMEIGVGIWAVIGWGWFTFSIIFFILDYLVVQPWEKRTKLLSETGSLLDPRLDPLASEDSRKQKVTTPFISSPGMVSDRISAVKFSLEAGQEKHEEITLRESVSKRPPLPEIPRSLSQDNFTISIEPRTSQVKGPRPMPL